MKPRQPSAILISPNEPSVSVVGCDGRTCRLIDPPIGLEGIINRYGDIREYILEDGTLSPDWERQRFAYVYPKFEMVLAWDTSVKLKRIRCHVGIHGLLQHVLDRIHERDLGRKIRHFGGSYNFRPQRGSHKLSTHSWGISLDLEPLDNQLGTLSVAKGGTGAVTFTDGGVLLGSGTGAITALAVLTDGLFSRVKYM